MIRFFFDLCQLLEFLMVFQPFFGETNWNNCFQSLHTFVSSLVRLCIEFVTLCLRCFPEGQGRSNLCFLWFLCASLGETAGVRGGFCRGNWNSAGGRNNLGVRPNILGRTPKYLRSVGLIPFFVFTISKVLIVVHLQRYEKVSRIQNIFRFIFILRLGNKINVFLCLFLNFS